MEDILRKLPAGALATAEQILKDNGVKPDLAPAVMRAIGYALFDTDLYPGDPANTMAVDLYLCYVAAGAGKDDFFDAPVVRDAFVTADVNEVLFWYYKHMKEANRKYLRQPYPWRSDNDLVAELYDQGQGIVRTFTSDEGWLIEGFFARVLPMKLQMTGHNSATITIASIEEQEYDREEPSRFVPVLDVALLCESASLNLWLNTVHNRMLGANYFLSPESKLSIQTRKDWWGQNVSFTYTNSPNGCNAGCERTIRLIPFEINFPERYQKGDLLICKPAEEKRKPDNIDFEIYAKVVLVSGSGETVVLQRYCKQGQLKMDTVSLPAWQARRYYQKMNEAEEAEFKKNCKEKNDGK